MDSSGICFEVSFSEEHTLNKAKFPLKDDNKKNITLEDIESKIDTATKRRSNVLTEIKRKNSLRFEKAVSKANEIKTKLEQKALEIKTQSELDIQQKAEKRIEHLTSVKAKASLNKTIDCSMTEQPNKENC